jgi:hypothetical protein
LVLTTARESGDALSGGEAWPEHLAVAQSGGFVGTEEPALEGLGADALGVQSAAVVANLEVDLSALVVGPQDELAHDRLAALAAFFRRIHEPEQDGGEGGDEGELALAEEAEEVLPCVGQRLQPGEGEKATRPLDGVDGAENAVESVAIVRVLLQGHAIAVEPDRSSVFTDTRSRRAGGVSPLL